jgi:hypothetical protein
VALWFPSHRLELLLASQGLVLLVIGLAGALHKEAPPPSCFGAAMVDQPAKQLLFLLRMKGFLRLIRLIPALTLPTARPSNYKNKRRWSDFVILNKTIL